MTPPEDFTIREARMQGQSILAQRGIESAALDARVLLAFALNETQTGLLMRDPELIDPLVLTEYQRMIEMRSTGMPAAYLVGEREFMGLAFRISPGVLVPRPDTEPLVEWGLTWLESHPHANIVDIGTGSGAIAVSIAQHATGSWTGSMLATDVSDDALRITTANADRLLEQDRRDRFDTRQGSLTAAIESPVDLLLTNLPYLTPDQIAGNPDLNHEPRLALDGGDDGLDLIRAVINDLQRVLNPDGAVGFELDPSQAREVVHLLKNALPGHRISTVRDLAGDHRHVIARL